MRSTHRCQICGAEWHQSKGGAWSLVSSTSDINVKIRDGVLTCCGSEIQPAVQLQIDPPREKTLFEKILGLFVDHHEEGDS